MICECGCGQEAGVYRKAGKEGQPRRFIHGHNGRKPLAPRFWSRVDRRTEDECWPWIGFVASHGYGRLGNLYAHRIAYELLRGPIPDHLELDHLCRNRRCVNPAHLELVTSAENSRRGISPAAGQARQTHCKRGHPLFGPNLAIRAGRRQCRICERFRIRRSRERRKVVG